MAFIAATLIGISDDKPYNVAMGECPLLVSHLVTPDNQLGR